MRNVRPALFALVAFSLIVPRSLSAAEPAPGKQVERHFAHPTDKKLQADYLLFLPEGYGRKTQKWPTILFLHGAGERGNGNLPLVTKHGPPKIVKSQPGFPFIVISPQCPTGQRWNVDVLTALLDEVVREFDVDTDRIFLTGLSMGGFGTWALAAAHPERFAAIVPICGGGNPENAEKLATLPIRVYHGGKDTAVPLRRSQEMVEAIRKAGGDVELTVYPDAGHDSWTRTYDDPKLYDWLLKQSASANAKKAKKKGARRGK